MPRSRYIHKSMLLRGVKFAAPALDRADIEATKGRASRSGRSYGGAPLRANTGNGSSRGNINYADQRPNPFAAYVNPAHVPPGAGNHLQGHAPPSAGDWRTPNGQAFGQGPPNFDNRYPQRYAPQNQGQGYGYPPPGWYNGYVPPPPPPYSSYSGNRPGR